MAVVQWTTRLIGEFCWEASMQQVQADNVLRVQQKPSCEWAKLIRKLR